MPDSPTTRPLRLRQLGTGDLPALQRLLDADPGYARRVTFAVVLTGITGAGTFTLTGPCGPSNVHCSPVASSVYAITACPASSDGCAGVPCWRR